MGASGSSTSSAKLFVPAGGSVQVSSGETSAPSQVNFLGMALPLGKLGLDMVIDIGCSRAIEDTTRVRVGDGFTQIPMIAVAARRKNGRGALGKRLRGYKRDFKLALRGRIQLVEMVKLTVILACVSTVSLPW